MKKLFVFVCSMLLVFVSLFCVGCGNMDFWDMNFILHYAVVKEGENYYIHKVESWSDSDSESVTIRCSCCGNYIWTSANSTVLYESEPTYLYKNMDIIKCWEKNKWQISRKKLLKKNFIDTKKTKKQVDNSLMIL